MLLVHPVREVVRFLPVLIGLLLFGRGSDGGPWALVGVAIPVALGLLRYLTTSYRLTAGRVEVRSGLLNKQVVSTPLDRVRTVDLTASPIHRALGLVTLRVGTGQTGDKGDGKLDLDGLSVAAAADQLRARLLRVSAGCRRPSPAPETQRRVVLTLDPRLGALRPADVLRGRHRRRRAGPGRPGPAAPSSRRRPSTSTSSSGSASRCWRSAAWPRSWSCSACWRWWATWSRTSASSSATPSQDGSWHLRRGLFTTRETSLDDARVSGVSIGEPLSLRLAGGARLSAIVTGLGRKQPGSSVLVPPAPRAEVDRVAAEVLGSGGPVYGAAADARTPRRTPTLDTCARPGGRDRGGRAVVAYVPASTLVRAARRLRPGGRRRSSPSTGPASLGHALVDGYLVARSGSLDRRREALATGSVIGWNLRSTWFQRRAGLTDLVATTAGGRQRVRVLDLPDADAPALARRPSPACSTSSWPSPPTTRSRP